jgi:hypothetical protein
MPFIRSSNTLRNCLVTAAAVLALGIGFAEPADAQQVQPPVHEGPAWGTWVQVYPMGAVQNEGGAGQSSASNSSAHSGALTGHVSYGAASLDAGTLKASAIARNDGTCGPDPWGGQAPCAVSAGARAAMWDTVQLMQAEDGAPVITNTLIPLELSIDGHMAGEAQAKFRFFYGYRENLNLDLLEWMDLADGVSFFNEIMMIPPTKKQFLYVELWTQAAAWGGDNAFSQADYGNTLHFNWTLPDGVYAQSDSGVFMSQGAEVPEPATWAMMLIGFGLSGAIFRRRRATSS